MADRNLDDLRCRAIRQLGETGELACNATDAEAALRLIAEASFAGGCQAQDLSGRLGELDQAIQVIWGREDKVIPASQAERLPAQVALRLLEGVGHMPHMEKASEVNTLISDFLAASER